MLQADVSGQSQPNKQGLLGDVEQESPITLYMLRDTSRLLTDKKSY